MQVLGLVSSLSQTTFSRVPPDPENTKSNIHSSLTLPLSSVKTPSPAGIVEPVKENASKVDSPDEIVKP